MKAISTSSVVKTAPVSGSSSTRKPKGFWNNQQNQKTHFDRLAQKLGITDLSQWYNISYRAASQAETPDQGRLLASVYDKSLYHALKTVYPEYNWLPWKFKKVPQKFWFNVKNRRWYLEWLAQELQLNTMEDWYQVKHESIVKHGGRALLVQYNDSVYQLLKATFTDVDWIPWKFSSLPKGIIGQRENLHKCIAYVTMKLDITTLEDWYRVSWEQLRQLGVLNLVQSYGSLYKFLQTAYPHHNWNAQLFSNKTKKSTQRWMKLCLQRLFVNEELHEDFVHPSLAYPETQRHVIFDVFLPKLSIAFEYHGEQHYQDVFFFSPQYTYTSMDQQKKELCKKHQITLLEVPYWWDKSPSSLLALVLQHKPDLISYFTASKSSFLPILSSTQSTDDPELQQFINQHKIPDAPPAAKSKHIPRVGNLIMLAENWDESIDPTGWWITEKLDGVRALWNGSKLFFRSGRTIPCPKQILESFPKDLLLDTELWIDRGKGEQLMNVLKLKEPTLHAWKEIQIVVFDSPSMAAQPFEERIQKLKELKSSGKLPNEIKVIEPIRCEGIGHLEQQLSTIKELGGEGIVLRRPQSLYESGRSNSMLKVKVFLDCEVKFVKADKDKNGLICSQQNGLECIVRCSGEVLEHPPPAGSILTVHHHGFWENGRIKYPTFVRERMDITW